jgi:caspase domain-containing protein/F5/8 type C domain-containing protein
MLRLSILLIGFMFSLPALAAPRVALVVGNSSYEHVPALDNPINDAKLMADTLRGLGFTLVGDAAQLNLDKAAFDKAVQDFGTKLQGADVGLFYYAGHGVQMRGANYLVPINANPTREADVDFQMLDAALVLRQMEGSGTRLNLVILDACRNNPFGGRGLRASGGGLAQMQAPEGTLISYATQPGNVAQDGADGNSPYTKALAATMQTPGLDIFQTFNAVGLQVKRATGGSQQPWVASSPIEGTFTFASGQQVATAPPPAPPQPPAPSPQPELVRLPEPAPAEAPRPRSANESCSLSGGMTICASSVLPPAHGNIYGPANLLDGNDTTAWVEGSGGQGVDDFLVFEFDAARAVSGLTIRNGYDKSGDIYGKNSRVKDVELRFSTGAEIETTLKDTPGEQHVALSRPVQAKWVQLIIRSVYPGWKYSDTAINEVRVDAR